MYTMLCSVIIVRLIKKKNKLFIKCKAYLAILL